VTRSLKFRPLAEKQLEGLDPSWDRIRRGLLRLAVNPLRAANVKAMADGNYRLRVGDSRVIYALEDAELVILVLRLGHRRDIYR
jgi:mRNA interferase RelE/StbE